MAPSRFIPAVSNLCYNVHEWLCILGKLQFVSYGIDGNNSLQSHLLGVFENVNEVDFHEKDYDRMMAVISKEGEKIMVSSTWNISGSHLLLFKLTQISQVEEPIFISSSLILN